MFLFATFVVFIALQPSSIAWSDYGHALIGSIALRASHPEVVRFYEEKLEKWNDEGGTIPEAAMWADWIKPSPPAVQVLPHSLKLFDSWHYIELPTCPFSDVEIPPHLALQQKHTGALWALKEIYRGLSNLGPDEGSALSWNLQLRLFLHIFGDIHQPLHTSTFYSKDLPKGDRGGNMWKLEGGGSLHSLWDDCAGQCAGRYPFSMQEVAAKAGEWAHRFPPSYYNRQLGEDFTLTNFRDIAAESHSIAETQVYQVLEATNFDVGKKVHVYEGYRALVEKVCMERVVLAGYRLAFLLDRLYRQNVGGE